MQEILLLAWSRFKIVASIIGDAQSHVIATLFYYTFLLPFGLFARYTNNRKNTHDDSSPQWLDRSAISSDLEIAKRQG